MGHFYQHSLFWSSLKKGFTQMSNIRPVLFFQLIGSIGEKSFVLIENTWDHSTSGISLIVTKRQEYILFQIYIILFYFDHCCSKILVILVQFTKKWGSFFVIVFCETTLNLRKPVRGNSELLLTFFCTFIHVYPLFAVNIWE